MPTYTRDDFHFPTHCHIAIAIELIHIGGALESHHQFNATDFAITITIAMACQLILEVIFVAIINLLPLSWPLPLPWNSISILISISILTQEEVQREAIAATDG